MNGHSTTSIPAVPVDRADVGVLTPTSERWNDPATVLDLAGVEPKRCGHLLDDECDADCDEFVAQAMDALFFDPIACRPAAQWGA